MACQVFNYKLKKGGIGIQREREIERDRDWEKQRLCHCEKLLLG